MNFVFISPNYPDNYWLFCRGLKKYGARVLAIVDQPYDSLRQELKDNCDEIFVVDTFHNYEQMLKACGYFTFKYGKIDWIESNNEAWLTLDAKLRDDFNVKSGFDSKTITEYQSKAGMKKYFKEAGLPTARYKLIHSLKEALDFAKEVGYPMVLKPDHGVGASFTYQIDSQQELKKVYHMTKQYQMILEEYVDGDIFTLDGITDGDGQVRYINSLEYVGNVMDSVVYQLSIGSYTAFRVTKSDQAIAQKVADAFQMKNRFFHGEYFRLRSDKEGLGKKGDVVGLEINFRPPGGFCPDLMNYSGNMDVYDLWAEILLTNNASYSKLKMFSSGFAGRRFSIDYAHSIDDIQEKFGDQIIDVQYLPAAYAAAMGDETIIARFTKVKERNEFYAYVFETVDEDNDE